ncbi:MAG TPA: hypothetical protein VHC22_24940 [Pirellulales bacterium]|nr:hypothetical protein [Pirellulales bacterium]
MKQRTRFVGPSLILALFAAPGWCSGAKPTPRATASEFAAQKPAAEAVDLFDAMQAGQVEVKFIPKNDKEARVRLKSKSGRPLTVRLPEAFAAQPILAQIGAGNAAGQNGASQLLGSTFNGQNNGNGANGGRMFNVPADKSVDLRVPCVCLEYGKPTPRAAIPYELVRLESVNQKASLSKVLAGLERGNQRDVQAAAWHIANDMTWQELATIRIEHLVEPNEPFFTARQLQRARELVRVATGPGAQPIDTQPLAVSLAETN